MDIKLSWQCGKRMLWAWLALTLVGNIPDSAALDPKKKITQYVYDVWQKKDGLPHQSVLTILQTKHAENEGYIWLGSYAGLIRFDGAKFVIFDQRNTPEFQNSTVLALCETPDGTIWIGTNGGGLLSLKSGKFQRYQAPEHLPSNIITSLACDTASSRLWIGTRKGLCKLELQTGKFTTYTTSNGLPSNSINVVTIDSKGAVWAGTDSGLWQLQQGVVSVYRHDAGPAPIPDNFVRTICEDRDGRIWIGTNLGISCFERTHWRTYTPKDGLVSEAVYAIFQDSDGVFWIGTIRGLSRFYDGKFENFTEKEGFEGVRVYAFIEDREGSLWFTTSRMGLNRFQDGSFLTFSKAEGLVADVIYSIYQDTDSSMWFGSFEGITHWTKDGLKNYTTDNGLPVNTIRAFLRAKDGKFWMASLGAGLIYYDGKKFRALTEQDGLPSNGLRTLCEAKDGTLWIGANVHGCAAYKDGKFTKFSTADGLTSNTIIALYASSDSTIWIATDGGGLNAYKNGRFSAYTSKEGLSGDVVFCMYEDAEHTLWVGTSGGLSRLKDGKITAYTSRNGLYGNDVFQILEDDDGYLWMNCNTGIFRVSKAELNEFAEGKRSEVSARAFGVESGMKTNEGITPATACKTKDGMLWFPTAKGAVKINPKVLPKNLTPPPVHIEEVYVDNERRTVTHNMVLEAGVRRLEFHYAGLSLLAPKKVRFRYWLEGFDKTWNEAETQRIAVYTNLPPSTYTFHVIACNNDGVWNEKGDSIRLTIKPFFYQTEWFMMAVVIGLGLSGVGIFRWHVASIVRREKELANLVEKRTRDLATAKQRLEIALQEAQLAREEMEIKRYEAEKLRQKAEEASRMKTELLGIVAHDLKNPLQSILGFALLIREKLDPNSDVYLMTQTILNAAERILRSIDGLLKTAALEEGKIELNKTLYDMSRLVEEVVSGNQMQAQNKHQTLSFQAEPNCMALVDTDKMREVIDNLISNAIKYSPQGTTITVRVQHSKDDDADGAPSVLISVRDEGQGLTEEDMKKLFGKFQRLSARPTAGESSTGLGLSIVKQLVELHGGKVWAESEGKNKGSIFRIELPSASKKKREE